MILGDELGIGHDPSQHAAYVGSWIKALKDDPMEIFRAAADAEKIQNYVLAFEQKQVQELQPDQAAELSEVLAVDIGAVLNNSETYTFDHYQDFEGASLDEALRRDGLATVGDVTGNNPDQFFDTAIKNLSPVFGIEPDDTSMSNAYLERKGLAQAFMSTAELLVQKQAQSLVSPIAKLENGVEMRSDNAVNSAEQLLANSVRNIEYAQDVIPSWRGVFAQESGNANVRMAIEFVENGEIDKALEPLWKNVELEDRYGGEESNEFRNVITILEDGWRSWQESNGVGPAITPEMLKYFNAIPSDLSQLSSATIEDYEKAAERARLKEEQVKNDPNSTTEDITAAREERKTAELVATVNNEEFQQKVAELEQRQETQTVAASESVAQTGQGQGGDKTFINVPYKEKEEVKALGAKWDRGQQSWYVPAGVELAKFDKWTKEPAESKPEQAQAVQVQAEAASADKEDRQYLAVPYTSRNEAKAAGALWDTTAKSWYAGPKADMEKLKGWLPENVNTQQEPAMTPREEFSEALTALGCVVSGQHPIMDGKSHRIETVGDKGGEKAGFYVAHLDGHPAGHIQNNRTGETLKWKSKGYSLSDEEKAKLQAESAVKLQEREAALVAKQNSVAGSVRELLAVAPQATADHKYLQSKGARPGDLRVVPVDGSALPDDSAVMIGKNWKESKALRDANPDKLVFTAGDLLLAAQDVRGEVRSVQSIQENGMKRFATGGAKQDTFHVVGGQGLDALAKVPAIVIGEGYATADTLSQSLGYATVAAFDSGNLPHVAKQLREQFPNKPFIIAGDNDVHQELTEGGNPGKEKALAAAKEVGGTALFPVFAPGEQSYPSDLAPVTLSIARAGELSDDQKAAIAKMKNFTDFNDLATKSAFGRDGVDRQVRAIVDTIVERQEQALEEQQQQAQKEQLSEKLVQRQENRRGIRV